MSVGWTEINPVLLELFSDLVRQPSAPEWTAEWEERREGAAFMHPEQGGGLYLKVTSCVPVGNDEARYEEIDGELHEITCGLRRFNLQVTAWEAEHNDSHWAIDTLEKLRTGLDRGSSREKLLAVNVDYTGAGPSRKTTQTYDHRRWSVGVIEITLTAGINVLDPVPVGWIERVLVTTQVADGDVLGAPPNTIGDAIPPYPPAP